MTIRCLIFDCDGVLVDSETIAARVAAECFTEAGLPVSAATLATRFAGLSGEKVTQLLAAEHGREPTPGMTDARRLRIMQAFRTELQPVRGVAVSLKAIGFPKCVASSSHPERVALSLAITGLSSYFGDCVFTSDLVQCGKPAPDLFLFAADKMGFPPQECLVIEDSVAGVQAGKAAGMDVFGFCGASHCRLGHQDRLRAAGAATIFSDMSELPELIAGRSDTSSAADADCMPASKSGRSPLSPA